MRGEGAGEGEGTRVQLVEYELAQVAQHRAHTVGRADGRLAVALGSLVVA